MGALDLHKDDVKAWADGKLAKQGLPLPKMPSNKDPEFEYPEDPSRLGSIEIGQWMSKFTGFFNYTTRLLGNVEAELVLVEAEYRLRVNTLRPEVIEDMPSRPAADVVESEVLRRHDELTPLYERRLQLLSVQKSLEARAKIYERGYQAMSRELSRRELEGRVQ